MSQSDQPGRLTFFGNSTCFRSDLLGDTGGIYHKRQPWSAILDAPKIKLPHIMSPHKLDSQSIKIAIGEFKQFRTCL